MDLLINNRGQIASEYLSLIALMLIFLAILVGVSLTTYYSTIKNQQVNDSLEELEFAAENVYSMGNGNSLKARIELPYGVEASSVLGRRISFTLSGLEANEIILDMNVHGSLPSEAGIHYIKVQAVDGNVSFEEV